MRINILFNYYYHFRSKQWLINCSREDLIGKSLTYFKVCSDHFLECMYKNIEKKVLLPHAIPTEFSNYNFT